MFRDGSKNYLVTKKLSKTFIKTQLHCVFRKPICTDFKAFSQGEGLLNRQFLFNENPMTSVMGFFNRVIREYYLFVTAIISTSQRLSMYKRIAGIKNEADAQDVYDELTDRFGAPPASVWGLIEIALLRNSAKSLGITDIVQRNGAILFYSSEPDIKTVAILNAFMKGRVTLSAAKRPYIAVKLEPTEATLETIRETLKIMSEAKEHYGKTE